MLGLDRLNKVYWKDDIKCKKEVTIDSCLSEATQGFPFKGQGIKTLGLEYLDSKAIGLDYLAGWLSYY